MARPGEGDVYAPGDGDTEVPESEAKRIAREYLEAQGAKALERSDTGQARPMLNFGIADAPPAVADYAKNLAAGPPTRDLGDVDAPGFLAPPTHAAPMGPGFGAPSPAPQSRVSPEFVTNLRKPEPSPGQPAPPPELAAGVLAEPQGQAPGGISAPGPVYHKGIGYFPTGRQISSMQYDPEKVEEAERYRQSGTGNVMGGISAETEAQRGMNQLVAQRAEQKAVADDAYLNGLKRANQEREVAYSDALSNIRAAQQKVAEAGTSGGFWAENPTASIVLSGIGVLMSGLNLKSGPALLGAIQHAVDADSRSQLQKLQSARAGLTAAQETAELQKGRAGEKFAQLEAIKAASYQKVINEIEAQMAASPGDAQIQAAGQKALGFFQMQASQAAEKSAQMTASQVSVHEGFDRGGYSGGAATPKVERNLIVRLPDGSTRIAQDSGDATLARQKIALDERQRLRDDESLKLRSELHDSDRKRSQVIYKRLKRLQEDTLADWSVGHKQGVVRDAEYERQSSAAAGYTEGIVSLGAAGAYRNPASFDATTEAIKEGRDLRDRENRAFINSLAPEEAATGYKQTPSGRLAPDTAFTGQQTNPKRPPKGFKELK